MFQIKFKFAHNNINVSDLDQSLKFYSKALNLTEIRRIEPENKAFKIVFLSDSESTHRLELTWIADHQEAYELGDNESHIAFSTDDFEMAHKLHEEMRCICYENIAMDLYFINDPDGYWIEILSDR